jgi:hypothetical protein
MALTIDIDETDQRINQLGASLFFDQLTLAHAGEHGIDDAAVLYGGGRAGAMGDVLAPTVSATFGFFEPGAVVEVTRMVWAQGPPTRLTEIFVAAMAHAARSLWSPTPAAEVVRVGRSLLDGASPFGRPLFAAWREVPMPSDPCGAAAVTIMALRELRGDTHVNALATLGIEPLQAEMVTRGDAWAQMHGWSPPYPDPDAYRDLVAQADALTSQRMADVYATIDAGDLERFAAAIGALDHP